ncbi:MAG: hypothetical protein L6V84_01830 [Oscillospiraceae bacterium]|nr:MAG: hypothetical protein L6V84_01830 [Oscillospiraceae bacterium]
MEDDERADAGMEQPEPTSPTPGQTHRARRTEPRRGAGCRPRRDIFRHRTTPHAGGAARGVSEADAAL